jgi:hypothetical protein
MTTPVQKHIISVLVALISLSAVCTSVAVALCGYRAWITRDFHIKDFDKLSTEARALALETQTMNQELSQDNADSQSQSQSLQKLASQGLLTAASEWDTGLRAGLAAWHDLMQPDAESAEESGKGRKSRGRDVVRVMREKCMEGIERRRELSVQLHRMRLAVVAKQGVRISEVQMGYEGYESYEG